MLAGEICTPVNVIPLNKNLSCCSNVIDKAMSIVPKTLRLVWSTMSLCIRFKLRLLSYHKAPERTSLDNYISQRSWIFCIMEDSTIINT